MAQKSETNVLQASGTSSAILVQNQRDLVMKKHQSTFLRTQDPNQFKGIDINDETSEESKVSSSVKLTEANSVEAKDSSCGRDDNSIIVINR